MVWKNSLARDFITSAIRGFFAFSAWAELNGNAKARRLRAKVWMLWGNLGFINVVKDSNTEWS
jgi:hypothetical protein